MSEFNEIMYQIKVYDDEYNKDIPDEWRVSLDNGKHYGRATQVYDFTKHRYIVVYVSDNYDIHTELQTLLQENEQLKELTYKYEEEYKTIFETWLKEINILTELEEYIGQEWYCFDNESIEFEVAKDILDKIQELKDI